MVKPVYFFLAQKGSELPEEADCVMCKGDETIAEFKKLVHQANINLLQDARVDAKQLLVFKHEENGDKCSWNAKLSACEPSGMETKPFRIFYEGIPVKFAF